MEDIILKRLVSDIRRVGGVRGAVIATPDGVTIASNVDEDPDEIGALAVILKITADEMTKLLNLGNPLEAVIEGEDYKLMALPWKEFIVGILMDKKASIYLVKKEVMTIFEEGAMLEEIR